MLNDKRQSLYYGKVGGTVITDNEDGIKHCAMSILYSLQHLGYTTIAAGSARRDRAHPMAIRERAGLSASTMTSPSATPRS